MNGVEMRVVYLTTLPICDIPACTRDARYDMPMKQSGPWANLCRPHALMYTYLPLWEIKGGQVSLGSELRLVEDISNEL